MALLAANDYEKLAARRARVMGVWGRELERRRIRMLRERQ